MLNAIVDHLYVMAIDRSVEEKVELCRKDDPEPPIPHLPTQGFPRASRAATFLRRGSTMSKALVHSRVSILQRDFIDRHGSQANRVARSGVNLE